MNTKRHIKTLLIGFCAMFLVLCVYLMYIWGAYGTRWFASPYNSRLNSQKNNVIPGDILDRNGIILASTDQNGLRIYPDDRSLRRATSHVVGDSYGQTFGADTFFSKYLLGFDQSIFERIGQAFSTEPRHGSDIRLTIDAKLSDHAYHALGEHKGAVVVMDYSTGEILCSVSSPDFDPKYMQEYLNGERELDDSAMVDRVTSGQYTPGSVFKIVTLTAALRYLPGIEERVFDCCGPLAFDPESGEYLEEVKITPEQDAAFREEAEGDTAGLSGEYSVVRDYNGEYHGELTLKEAFMKSCNHVFAQLAMEVGEDRLRRVAKDLGFGDDFLFSDMVVYPSSYEKPDTALELSWAGVGQYKDIMTPLHMCMIAAGIGNGGVALEPSLLKAVEQTEGFMLSNSRHSVYQKLFSEREAEVLKEYMLSTVENGTGRRARVDGVSVAGKTGTAEVSGKEKPNAWFAGFIAESEHPLAICVVLEKGGSGGSNAAPIAGDVLEKAVALGY